jgi:hypothetical protein
MFDWIGTLRIRTRSGQRLELALTRSTTAAGWVVTLAGVMLASAVWRAELPRVVWVLPGLVLLLGLMLATMRRELVFDGDDGVLRIEQRVLGLASRAVVPLFHLRAVVIAAREGSRIGPKFIAYVDRRVGARIHLDESQRCASLMPIAEAIAEVADLRLVYDATARAAMR